jgi:hypothetical protein
MMRMTPKYENRSLGFKKNRKNFPPPVLITKPQPQADVLFDEETATTHKVLI